MPSPAQPNNFNRSNHTEIEHFSTHLHAGKRMRLFGTNGFWMNVLIKTFLWFASIAYLVTKTTNPEYSYKHWIGLVFFIIIALLLFLMTVVSWNRALFAAVRFSDDAIKFQYSIGRIHTIKYSSIISLHRTALNTGLAIHYSAENETEPPRLFAEDSIDWRPGLAEAVSNEIILRAGLVKQECQSALSDILWLNPKAKAEEIQSASTDPEASEDTDDHDKEWEAEWRHMLETGACFNRSSGNSWGCIFCCFIASMTILFLSLQREKIWMLLKAGPRQILTGQTEFPAILFLPLLLIGIFIIAFRFWQRPKVRFESDYIELKEWYGTIRKIPFSEIVAASAYAEFSLGGNDLVGTWGLFICHQNACSTQPLRWYKVISSNKTIVQLMSEIVISRAGLTQQTDSDPNSDEFPWTTWRRQEIDDLPPLKV